MTLIQFCDVLKTVSNQVFHYEAFGGVSGEHIIWQETGGRSLYGSDRRQEVIREVQVDLYTKTEYTETLDKLLTALEEAEVSFEEPVTSYEKETGYIRHTIECEVI